MQYKQLTKGERYYIECRKANNISIGVRSLALEMKRSPSIISRCNGPKKKNSKLKFSVVME